MAKKKLTLLELNLGDGTIQIGPATLGDGANGTPETETETDADDAVDGADDGCGCPGRKAGKLLLVVLVLALLVFGIKKALGGGEDLDELEDLADLDADDA
jgi:hypothetical protein